MPHMFRRPWLLRGCYQNMIFGLKVTHNYLKVPSGRDMLVDFELWQKTNCFDEDDFYHSNTLMQGKEKKT